MLPAAIAIVAQGSASSLGGGYVEDYLYLPPDEVRGRILRAIRVTGECMITDGIEPDDILLIARRSEAYPDGTGVVAVLLDTNEVVIKRLYHKPASGLLELRASDGSPPLMVPTDRVRIEGAILKVTRVRDFKQPPPYRIGW